MCCLQIRCKSVKGCLFSQKKTGIVILNNTCFDHCKVGTKNQG